MKTYDSNASKNTAVPADFETSIASTGFGRYNVLLILICIPAAWTTQFESSLASFIIPAAACDLNLTTSQKGLLNSMAVIGMITSGFIWGVLLDTLGRRKLLLIAFVIDSLLVVGRSLSQEFYVLCAFKFFGGSITGGIYVAINTYLLEFHSTEYRGKIQMIFGMIFCGANIVIPLISSAILPLKFHMQIFVIDFSAWNLLILVTSTTSFISCVGFYFLPESPKFLMSIGDNVGAMEVFKKIYTHNSGKPAESYPISCLLKEIEDKNESPANKKSLIEYFKAGKQQVLPLFGKQYGPKLLLVSVVQSTFQMAINAVRFYMPQIFQGIHEYQVANNETFSDICDVLDILRSPKPDEEYTCLVNLENSFTVYLNSVIIATVALISYGMVGTLINLFGKKRLLITLGITSSVTVSSMYLSKNPASIITLSSLYLATSGICFDLFITVVVVVFPTTLRAMAFSLCLLLGRILTVVGNMGFPMLVEIGCAPPFLAIGGLILVAVALVCIMPNTDKVNMK